MNRPHGDYRTDAQEAFSTAACFWSGLLGLLVVSVAFAWGYLKQGGWL